MSRPILLALVLALFVVLLVLMVLGWLGRRRRQRHIAPLETVPEDPGEVLGRFEALYVSTTADGQPLNRIAVRGLGFRARVTLTVAVKGIIVNLPGAEFFIAAPNLREVTTSRYTIDRVVEENGLVLVAWLVDGVPLDSYFRLTEQHDLIDAITSILPASAVSGAAGSSGSGEK